MSRVDAVEDDEPASAAKTGGVSMKKTDMLKLSDSWGITEPIIKKVSKALVMPKITPLRAFFKTVQENAFDIVDCVFPCPLWDEVSSCASGGCSHRFSVCVYPRLGGPLLALESGSIRGGGR